MRTDQLLTSIRLEDGQFDLLHYHAERINRSRRLLFGEKKELDLATVLAEQQPPARGLFKTRVLYRQNIEQIEFAPYQVKQIHSLQTIHADGLDYAYKYSDRTAIHALYQQRGTADDILIVIHQRITDTSYANVAFWDGQTWLTPHRPLLRGTRRQQLLDDRIIYQAAIGVQDVTAFSKMRLFNAMLPWNLAYELSVTDIHPSGQETGLPR